MEFEVLELSNGIRVVHKTTDRPIAHCGLHIAAGPRDELEIEEGLAHYIEHCLFKGTQKRKPFHILSRMENVGGELNASTTKEQTVIYTSFLAGDYLRAVELIADLVFRSTFPEKEIHKEKEVIIDEINSCLDIPSESIFDDFEDQIFTGHPLGHNVLGTEKSVKSFQRNDILQFIQRNYGTNRMVFSSVGKISSFHLQQILERELQNNLSFIQRHINSPDSYQRQSVIKQREGFQTHAILGGPAYAANHEKARTLMLLNNLLGGPGMNSRLSLNIREKYGFTYHIESFYHSYSDTGLFGIYLGTTPSTIDRILKLVEKELKKLRTHKLGALQLSKAKRQFLGQVAMAHENNALLMLGYGKSLLTLNKIDTFEAICQKIESITVEDILEVANEILLPDLLSLLIYKSDPQNKHGILT